MLDNEVIMCIRCETMQPSTQALGALQASEVRLLRLMRALGHGLIEVKVVDGRPVAVERGIEKFLL